MRRRRRAARLSARSGAVLAHDVGLAIRSELMQGQQVLVMLHLPQEPWSPWHGIGRQTQGTRQRIDARRKLATLAIVLLVKFLVPMLQVFSPECLLVVMSWPTRCHGWKAPGLEPLREELPYPVHFDSCRYGLVVDRGSPVKRPWTCSLFTSPSPRDRPTSRMLSSA